MNPLNSATSTIAAGLALAVLIALVATPVIEGPRVAALLIWVHVLAGVAWVGLLYYFNLVQIPALSRAAAAEDRAGADAILRYVTPPALLWFRWTALATWVTGFAHLAHNGQLGAFALGLHGGGVNAYQLTIGIGAWLGTLMLVNVWVLIWPNQKKVLGLSPATTDEQAAAKRTAFLASRTNVLLSIPMLMSMVGAGHGFFL